MAPLLEVTENTNGSVDVTVNLQRDEGQPQSFLITTTAADWAALRKAASQMAEIALELPNIDTYGNHMVDAYLAGVIMTSSVQTPNQLQVARFLENSPNYNEAIRVAVRYDTQREQNPHVIAERMQAAMLTQKSYMGNAAKQRSGDGLSL